MERSRERDATVTGTTDGTLGVATRVTVLVTRRPETGSGAGDSNSARSVALIDTSSRSGDEASVARLVRPLIVVSEELAPAIGIGAGTLTGTGISGSIISSS